MLPFISKDIKSRIVITTIRGMLFSSIIFGGLVLIKTSNMSESALKTRIGIEADILASNINIAMTFGYTEEATVLLSSAASDKAIISATLQRGDEKDFAKYVNSKAIDSDLRRAKITRKVIAIKHDKVIAIKHDIEGILTIEYSFQEVAAQKKEVALFLVLSVFVAMFTTLFLCLPRIKALLMPLLSLHSVSQQIARTRNYSLRAEVGGSDEVGRLSSVFNSMLEQIENRDLKLEKKVSQRTQELEKLAEEFRFRAFHDTLTGLPNRALLNENFDFKVKHAEKHNSRFGCLLLDLDDFKTINDTKGHEFGDDLLKEVAKRLKNSAADRDLVCRLGGDEFVILVDELESSEQLQEFAEEVLYQLNLDFSIKSECIKTAVSLGGAIFPDHGEDISTIKRHADVAMYRAKDAGKNQFCMFSEGMGLDAKYRLIIQNGLQAAKDEQQFEIYFQPKIDARMNKAVGCEALLRWNHPEEGFLMPGKFIPYAEEIGKVREIDYYVIRQCCEKIAQWHTSLFEPMPIAVNLSGRHFHDLRIVDILRDAIYTSGVNPNLLDIEITEAVLIRDPETARKIVNAMKDLGCGISLDDFGTGYSSLDYLRTLPIDSVKLDKSFIENIDTNIQDMRLTKGIVSLAKSLDLKIIAEGVETLSHKKALLDLGCYFMQGFYFLPPVNAKSFIDWVEKSQRDGIIWGEKSNISHLG